MVVSGTEDRRKTKVIINPIATCNISYRRWVLKQPPWVYQCYIFRVVFNNKIILCNLFCLSWKEEKRLDKNCISSIWEKVYKGEISCLFSQILGTQGSYNQKWHGDIWCNRAHLERRVKGMNNLTRVLASDWHGGSLKCEKTHLKKKTAFFSVCIHWG